MSRKTRTAPGATGRARGRFDSRAELSRARVEPEPSQSRAGVDPELSPSCGCEPARGLGLGGAARSGKPGTSHTKSEELMGIFYSR